jgi:hypothetical protein
MLRGYSLFENPPTTMTDVRTSNIQARPFDLRLNGAIAKRRVSESQEASCCGASGLH